jgi:hypothetical protein
VKRDGAGAAPELRRMAVMCPRTMATPPGLTAQWGDGRRNVVKLMSELTTNIWDRGLSAAATDRFRCF